MIQKKAAVTALVITLLGGTVLMTGAASAQDSSGSLPTIVQRLAEKFNLSQSEVQAVFDEHREVRHGMMQEKLTEKLSQAVSDGKITDAQKQAILNKFQEMKNNKPDPGQFSAMTPEQRRQEMQEKREEHEAWAKENGLDPDQLHDLMGNGGRGFGMKGMWRNGSVNTPTP